MKRFAVILAVLALLSSVVYAEEEEEARLKNVTVSWGDSAFTSGLNVSMLFSLKDNRDMELVGNSDRFYATINSRVGRKLSLDFTGGVFKKIPWAGPRVVITPVKPVMFMYWGGWSAGRIGGLKPEVKSFCQQFSLYAAPAKNVSVGYTVIKVDTYKTTMLPEIAYSHPLREDLRLGASATYDTTERKPLFCMSLSYNLFQKKK